jgi:hypothetical protein
MAPDSEHMPTAVELIGTTVSALSELLTRDAILFEVDAHEQTITHRLASYMQPSFPGWSVDCEYNRRGHVVKRLPSTPSVHLPNISDENGSPIKPDIIVHQRHKKANLLVVEVKKVGNYDLAEDARKLRGLTNQSGWYGYLLGMHIVFNCNDKSVEEVHCYKNGAEDRKLSARAGALLAKLNS